MSLLLSFIFKKLRVELVLNNSIFELVFLLLPFDLNGELNIFSSSIKFFNDIDCLYFNFKGI